MVMNIFVLVYEVAKKCAFDVRRLQLLPAWMSMHVKVCNTESEEYLDRMCIKSGILKC